MTGIFPFSKNGYYSILKGFLYSCLAIITAIFFVGALYGGYIRLSYPTEYREEIEKWYADAPLVLAVIKAESAFDESAKSTAGACGLMQILPETAEFIAKREEIISYDLFCPQDNIRLGCLYIRYLQNVFSDRTSVLCAYNAGEGTVRKWLRDKKLSADGKKLNKIPYKETDAYISKIEKYYTIYRRICLTN